ncbi:receptor-like serine/threonine-protein kinase SD1-8 [Cinnamomum micranthum f. kanehirae]|uniref:Receptor-like serine/threonine-protein kinase SD1-8 n=1 Tax=Cinnamomum micranthum f. kanehirae TaxID=337451 RepID=A0A3S3MXL9_9MAGN|nr:receptor-like serine/threonine-protein kinase SD1-8 [Cinnamomum micranthum f. kanehirae]
MKPNSVYGFYCVSTPDEVYYTYDVLNSSLISRLVLNRTGHIERYIWDEESGGSNWKLYWSAPKDQCDEYSECGPYGICNVNSSSVCHCVKGFEPKTPDISKARRLSLQLHYQSSQWCFYFVYVDTVTRGRRKKMNERHGDIFNDNETEDSGKGSELQLFSFNVIVAVTKNFSESNMIGKGGFGLVYKVWELWKEDRILELIDSSMSISTSKSEVLRCIQVGLLCVQEKAIDRPNMSSVIYMLGDERIMPSPKQPAFSFWKGNCSDHPQSSTNCIDGCSKNEITITELEARY